MQQGTSSITTRLSVFSERWFRGVGLTIRVALVIGVAWGIPQGIGQLLVQSETLRFIAISITPHIRESGPLRLLG